MNIVTPMPPAMILCGGQGTRIRDVSEVLPKPMVPIGSRPMLWHIMKVYAAYGVTRFILCLGYKREFFIDYFLNYRARSSDITIRLGDQDDIVYHGKNCEEDWEITLVDTGERAMTGSRIACARKYLDDKDQCFFLTYGDAVADIDVQSLLACHQQSGKLLTVTAVHPVGRFGEMSVAGEGSVRSFHEKPQVAEGYINGGFMVADRSLPDRYLVDQGNLVFEQEPMRKIASENDMYAYKHEGYWQCMDTAREYQLLNDLWNSGKAPWSRGWR